MDIKQVQVEYLLQCVFHYPVTGNPAPLNIGKEHVFIHDVKTPVTLV
jgi:hypothetical protein